MITKSVKFRWMHIISVIFLIAILMLPVKSLAKMDWSAEITISCVNDSNKLILGSHKNASDGFENAFEGRAILSGYLMAYFYHPEWGVDTDYFWSDIKDGTLPKEWTFNVESKFLNRDIVIKWNLEVPQSIDLILADDTSGNEINMKTTESYTFRNTSGSIRSFRVKVSGLIDTLDTTPPETVITSEIDDIINSSDVSFSFTGSDDVTPEDMLTYAYRSDEGAWSQWSASVTASIFPLSEGSHSVYVKARDEAGNEDPSPASASFLIDTSPPHITLNQPKPGVLWPPNGKMVNTSISGTVSDELSGMRSLSYVLSDEYGELGETGSLETDTNGHFSFLISLKAERNAKDEDGRQYTITLIAADLAGNTISDNVKLLVPKSQARIP